MEVQNEDDIGIDDAMQDADAQEIQGQIMERMATFGIEMEDMQEIQEALDIPIMDDELDMDVGEEEEIMENLAASEMSEEEVDVEMEAQVSVGGEDIDVEDMEVDIDDIEDEELGI